MHAAHVGVTASYQESRYLNGEKLCADLSEGSRGVSIINRRSPSRRMKANPNRGSTSISQASTVRRSIAAANGAG
jgi:hypothetical protein